MKLGARLDPTTIKTVYADMVIESWRLFDRLQHLDRHLQQCVACQAEQEVDAIGLKPCHQRLAGEAGIAAQQDPRPRPVAADLGHDPRHLLDGPSRGIDVGPPQPGRQQMTAAEDMGRQVAIAVVIAVEEPAFLMSMQRIIRRIEVEDDLRQRAPVRLEEEIDTL